LVELHRELLAETTTGERTAERDAVLVRKLIREELSFIANAEFSSADVGEEVFAEKLELAPGEKLSALGRRQHGDLPAHLGRMCEARLLTPHQERLLFRRMNFLRQEAARYRSLLDPQKPDGELAQVIEHLLSLSAWHRDRLVEANLRLVFSIVKKFVNRFHAFEDLLSDGIVALLRAVEKFDFDRGFRFSTYATQVVRRGAYRTVLQKQRDRSRLTVGLQDMENDLSEQERSSAISEQRWHELRGRLTVMLSELDRREKFIVRARFSLGSHRRVHTLQALADRLGVSKERVRQLEKRALDKLRGMAGGQLQLAELAG
jgi:RNA polymerase primary sigma factor